MTEVRGSDLRVTVVQSIALNLRAVTGGFISAPGRLILPRSLKNAERQLNAR
jgi:hypothetical protein